MKREEAESSVAPAATPMARIDVLLAKPRNELCAEEIDEVIAELSRRRERDALEGPPHDPHGAPADDDIVEVNVPALVGGHYIRCGDTTYYGVMRMRRTTWQGIKRIIWDNARAEQERLTHRGNLNDVVRSLDAIRPVRLRDLV
jgi:hypothetical protein